MKKILGLDLGTNSIGWALIEVDDNKPNKNSCDGLKNNSS
jgi:CRISPR/Cas system Type II protein with McrA/HNH and RuvC-like nuclease domain